MLYILFMFLLQNVLDYKTNNMRHGQGKREGEQKARVTREMYMYMLYDKIYMYMHI
jgi:hypothetical protein